ncbi:energy transducer TonB, partial [Pseudomonas aeruginosa]
MRLDAPPRAGARGGVRGKPPPPPPPPPPRRAFRRTAVRAVEKPRIAPISP